MKEILIIDNKNDSETVALILVRNGYTVSITAINDNGKKKSVVEVQR